MYFEQYVVEGWSCQGFDTLRSGSLLGSRARTAEPRK